MQLDRRRNNYWGWIIGQFNSNQTVKGKLGRIKDENYLT